MSTDPAIRYLLSLVVLLVLLYTALILQVVVDAWWMVPLWIAVGWQLRRVLSGSAPYRHEHVEDRR